MILKYTVQIIMFIDSFKYATCYSHFRGVINSMLEPYLIFTGRTPHLYKNFDSTDKNNFNRA